MPRTAANVRRARTSFICEKGFYDFCGVAPKCNDCAAVPEPSNSGSSAENVPAASLNHIVSGAWRYKFVVLLGLKHAKMRFPGFTDFVVIPRKKYCTCPDPKLQGRFFELLSHAKICWCKIRPNFRVRNFLTQVSGYFCIRLILLNFFFPTPLLEIRPPVWLWQLQLYV